MEIFFIIIWVLIVFFYSKDNKSVKTLSSLVQQKSRAQRYQPKERRTKDIDSFDAKSSSVSLGQNKKRKSSPWGTPQKGKAELRAASLKERQTERMLEMSKNHD